MWLLLTCLSHRLQTDGKHMSWVGVISLKDSGQISPQYSQAEVPVRRRAALTSGGATTVHVALNTPERRSRVVAGLPRCAALTRQGSLRTFFVVHSPGV